MVRAGQGNLDPTYDPICTATAASGLIQQYCRDGRESSASAERLWFREKLIHATVQILSWKRR